MVNECPRCGSHKMIPDVHVIDREHGNFKGTLEVEVHKNPQRLLFKGSSRSQLFAVVCGQCGYSELYAKHPAELYQAYLKSKK